MAFWLMKSEPFKYAWAQLLKDGRTYWDGVRNHQAANNLKAMRRGDRAFFYHSNEGLEIVGTCEIVTEAYQDPTDESGRWVVVDIEPREALPRPVSLKTIKATPELAEMALVRQSRLSVSPVRDAEWALICKLGDLGS